MALEVLQNTTGDNKTSSMRYCRQIQQRSKEATGRRNVPFQFNLQRGTKSDLCWLDKKLIISLVALLCRHCRRRAATGLLDSKQHPPVNGSFQRPLPPGPVLLVGPKLFPQGGDDPLMRPALVGVLEREQPALEEESISVNHRVAADGKLEVGIGRRARGPCGVLLHDEVAGERDAWVHRRHHRRAADGLLIQVAPVNACHLKAKRVGLSSLLYMVCVCVRACVSEWGLYRVAYRSVQTFFISQWCLCSLQALRWCDLQEIEMVEQLILTLSVIL